MSRMVTKQLSPSRLLKVCLIGLALIVALMPIHAFVSTWGGTAIGPLLVWKSWKEILLVALLLVFGVWLTQMPGRLKQFFDDRFVAIIGLYALMTVIYGIFFISQNGLEATVAGVMMNLRYPLIALLFYGVFRFSAIDYAVWRRYAAGFLIAAGTMLALIGIAQVTVIPKDFLSQFGYDKTTTIAPYTLIDQNPDALRAFATLRGPNDFGAYLILPLLLTCLAIRKRRWMIMPLLLMVEASILSGSRSAWIGTLVAGGCLSLFLIGRKLFASKKLLSGIAVGFVSALIVFYAAFSIPSLRLAIFHSSPGDSSLTEGSTDQHWKATSAGLHRVATNPLGCGPGCAGPASYYGNSPEISENYYVQILEEVGIGGALLWATLVAIVARRLYRARGDWIAQVLLASGIGISVIGLLLHVWSDDPLSLTWWALAGMVLGVLARTYTSKSLTKSVL